MWSRRHLDSGGCPDPNVKPVPPILLFAMLAVASRYAEDDKVNIEPGMMWMAGVDYANQVREIICTVLFFHFENSQLNPLQTEA